MQQLFEERQIGDYDIESEITKKEAEQNLNDASILISAVKKYLNKAGIKILE